MQKHRNSLQEPLLMLIVLDALKAAEGFASEYIVAVGMIQPKEHVHLNGSLG